VLLSNARFFEPAVFRGLVSWHGWVALSRESFRLWSHFPPKNSSVDLRTRACSGKPRGRQTDLMHRMQETAFWVRVSYAKIATDEDFADAAVNRGAG